MGLLEFGLVTGIIPLLTPVMKYVVFDLDAMLFFSCCIRSAGRGMVLLCAQRGGGRHARC